MISKTVKPIVVLLLLLVLGLAPVLTQDGEGNEKPETEFLTPQHEWLDELAGDWNINSKMWQSGSDEPFEVSGSSTMEMLWGRYLSEEFSLGEAPMVIKGVGTIGFDDAAEKFKSMYCLNTGTGMTMFTGTRDDDGDVLTLKHEGEAPDGTITKSRTVMTRDGDDKLVKEYYFKRGDDPEFKRFEMTYTRKDK